MDVLSYLNKNVLFLDGGTGTLLQQAGLMPGEYPEMWNITHSDIVERISRDYYNAGSNVVSTNTFGANILKFSHSELDAIVKAAIENVNRAKQSAERKSEKFVALDLGPIGRLLKPYGDFEFEDAVSVFAETVKCGVKYGVDLILIETMNDSYETKAALLAAKENSNLPVFVSNAYGEDGKLITGASPAAMVAMLEGMGADAIGANCSLGPKQLKCVVEELLKYASVPVIFKPNAGLPKSDGQKTFYDVSPDEFATDVADMIRSGVRIAGGCCGTTPEYIKNLTESASGIVPLEITQKDITCVSSYTHIVEIGETPVLIGERINPTGKKRFKQALRENDMDYILSEGIKQQDSGVHILDVNVGLPDIDEPKMLTSAITELQAIINLPLQIDTSDTIAMERALRCYNGKAMVNSVNGKEESMRAVFPLIRKYGGVVVALTLDENGIPSTAEGRLEIARKILKTAGEYGIKSKDIVFDTLAMAVSADSKAARVTLDSLKMIKSELSCKTSLGVSNISFGLPSRDCINSAFFALALENGLSAAIMNPFSDDMMKVYYSYRALNNLDDNFADYIKFALSETAQGSSEKLSADNTVTLQRAIIKGLREQAAEIAGKMLSDTAPLDIVSKHIIPALDVVGRGFEEKTVYLPQLLMSAETAKSSFEVIKSFVAEKNTSLTEKCSFVIATVHGDIHDIGKNIVKMLLENYGFRVVDLGKDVAPDLIAEKVVELHAPIAGLSALMTTTVPAMERTIAILREKAPWCKIVVGGAVLTQEYADMIGADKYAEDAMETVRYAESINISLGKGELS